MNNAGKERGQIVSELAPITNESLSREEPDSQEQLRLAELIRDVGLALIQSTSLHEMAQQCAQSLVNYFDAAFARIWTLNEQSQILELQASAGLYTHLNGVHSRIQVGTFKIGLIASERLPHLTNDVMHDPRVSDQEWARQEGMVAFAGYPLLVSNRVVGVMALFARHALSPSVLDAMASVANTIAVGLDRKQVEQERIHLLEATQRAHAEAEAALAIRTTFLSSVSHDLKTPLASIKANTQLIQRRVKRGSPPEGEWLSERLGAIERATMKMNGMIDDLLSLTRLQQGQAPEEEFSQLDFLLLLKAAITEQQATSKRHRLLLTVHDEPFLINGNATRLDRMLTNLLGNAIKYSPGGGEITVLLTKEQSSWAVLRIADPGVGIPASDLPLIFERFHRASNVVGQIQGTGIGLASVVQVVEQHQGNIAVTSEEGQGSTFTIRLPLLAVDETQFSSE